MVLDEDRYGSFYREVRKEIMSEPAQSTAEKFRALNRRDRHNRIIDYSCAIIWKIVWALIAVIILSKVFIHYHHG